MLLEGIIVVGLFIPSKNHIEKLHGFFSEDVNLNKAFASILRLDCIYTEMAKAFVLILAFYEDWIAMEYVIRYCGGCGLISLADNKL